MIKRQGKAIQVTLQLQELGSFGADYPQSSAKASYLAELNARILLTKQLPDGMWSNGFKKKGNIFSTCMVATALMSMGEKDYGKAVKKAFEAVIHGDDKMSPWIVAYKSMFLGEYYLRYKE